MSESLSSDSKISRRRVVQGALWAAPAIAIATAIPAAAASGVTNGTMTPFGTATLQRYASTNPRSYVFSGLALAHGGGTGAPITNLTITITSSEALTVTAGPSGPWTLISSDPLAFTFSYTGGPLTTGLTTAALGVTLARPNTGGGQPVAVFSASAVGDTNATTTGTVPIPVTNLLPVL